MCGIIGLLIKNKTMHGDLGKLLSPMMINMTERGPDSAGIALYSEQIKENWLNFFTEDTHHDWQNFLNQFQSDFQTNIDNIEIQANHCRFSASLEAPELKQWLIDHVPSVHLLSVGKKMNIYKDQGRPQEIINKYNFEKITGTHAIAHTRMATESAITPLHAHPYSTGKDFCLVHNGSLSNPYDLRRMLEKKGIKFDTDNDTEAACRFIEWRLREGDTLKEALEYSLKELDGFYTFLIGTENEIALLRDPFACKPAIIAETDDYIAIGSEYQAISELPSIEKAVIFEPKPEHVYTWSL